MTNEVLRVTRDENPVVGGGARARMARDERARRLRLGDRVRRDRAALSRFSDRGAAGAARPGRAAERPRRRDRARRRQHGEDPRRRQFRRVHVVDGAAELALGNRRRDARTLGADAGAAQHRAHHVPADRGRDRRAPAPAAVHQLSPARSRRRQAAGGRLPADRAGTALRGLSRPGPAHPADDHGRLRRQHVHLRWRAAERAPVPNRGRARL